jgi:hypothetical protein
MPQADMIGTVVQLYLPEEDIYDVELDDDGFPRLMVGRELELLDSAAYKARGESQYYNVA